MCHPAHVALARVGSELNARASYFIKDGCYQLIIGDFSGRVNLYVTIGRRVWLGKPSLPNNCVWAVQLNQQSYLEANLNARPVNAARCM